MDMVLKVGRIIMVVVMKWVVEEVQGGKVLMQQVEELVVDWEDQDCNSTSVERRPLMQGVGGVVKVVEV